MKLHWTSLGLIALAGCSDPAPAVTTDVPSATDAGDPIDAGTPSDVGNRPDSGAPTDALPADAPAVADAPPAGPVVINEIRALGDDWVELKNVSASSFDLSNMVLADTDTDVDGGAPRLGDGMTFPAGTTLGAGQHLLIVADLSMPPTGPQMVCLGDAGPMTCYHAGFGISAPRGERIYLLTSAGSEVAHGDYPPNGAPEGRTWGRLPDGTGPFAVTAPTPGGANAAP